MFRPDIYLVILKIALKMSFWCSKNKILVKVPCHLTASSQNLSRKISHMLIIPYNFLNGFELISKMTCGTSQSAEIRRLAENAMSVSEEIVTSLE